MTGHKTNAEIVLGQRCVCAMRLQLMHNARYTAINCGQLNQHKYKLLADTASGRGVWARGVVVGPPQRNVPKYPLKQLNALTAKRIDKWQSATLLPATFPSSSSSAEALPTPTPVPTSSSSSSWSSLSFVRYRHLGLFKMQMPLWHATGRSAFVPNEASLERREW